MTYVRRKLVYQMVRSFSNNNIYVQKKTEILYFSDEIKNYQITDKTPKMMVGIDTEFLLK